MSANDTVYVELFGEGTKCWRPVQAESLGGALYRILGQKPSDEIWSFSTGDVVKCKLHTFQNGVGMLAYEKDRE